MGVKLGEGTEKVLVKDSNHLPIFVYLCIPVIVWFSLKHCQSLFKEGSSESQFTRSITYVYFFP